jgi:hypothetical protein
MSSSAHTDCRFTLLLRLSLAALLLLPAQAALANGRPVKRRATQ